MLQQIRIHEVVRSNHIERDEWYLVLEPCGSRYVLFETLSAGGGPDRSPQWRKHRLAVKTILAQNNELSRKLRCVLCAACPTDGAREAPLACFDQDVA